MHQEIFNPLEFYKKEGGEKHGQYTQELFDCRLKESGVDPDANRAVVRDYEEQMDKCSALKNRRLLSALGGIALLLCIALGIACLFQWETSAFYIPAGIALILLGSCLIFGKLYPACKVAKEQLLEAEENAQRLLQCASGQIEPLNRMFTSRDGIELVEQVVPGLSFLDHFTKEHLARLQCYGFREHTDEASSVCRTLAGTFNRNPFLLTSRLSCSMVDETYEGSKTIYWEEEERQYVPKTRTVTDSSGNERTETYYEWETVTVEKSQVLTAERTAPKPVYTTESILGYGHHAAPDLAFTRKAGHAQRMSENRLQTKVKSGARKLQRRNDRALMGEADFTAMVNEKFDVLFGAADRNNARQFLYLFTPLAQQNMVALLTDPALGGDEFSFRKEGQYNTVSCANSVLEPSPLKYHAYSVDQARERFLSYQRDYFRSMLGCFAPLLAIPAYQEPPLAEQDFGDTGEGCFPLYEREAIVNGFDPSLLKPDGCSTKVILKTELLSHTDTTELVRVHSHGFATRDCTTTYRIKGRDGYYHNVDVDWTEYIPKTKTVTILIEGEKQSAEGAEAPSLVHFHGLTAKIIESSQEESL